MPTARPALADADRIVIKLGTRVLTHDDGRIALSRLYGVVEAAAELLARDRDVLIVSSGAVGLGREALGFEVTPDDLEERQACAAVGQGRLMGLYDAGFGRLGRLCAQVLLTQGDFDDRIRYLNLRSTLETLLRRGVVPVINENDAVSTEELALASGERRRVFGDNDRLSALVASELDADLLVLLTDVDGVFERDPRDDPEARLLTRVEDPESLLPVAGGSVSGLGRGGMRSKVEAAAVATRAGCDVVIASGRKPGALPAVLTGEEVGTWFPAREGGLDAHRRWIAFAVASRGTLHLDTGAVEAVRHRGASLLAAGVREIEGRFRRGDVVELRDPEGRLVGRGRMHWDVETTRRWCQGHPPDEAKNRDALIHRRHLVLDPHPPAPSPEIGRGGDNA